MPSKRWRVVCALREVMANFIPKIWLSSVDLPTLGRPTMATVPHLNTGGLAVESKSDSVSKSVISLGFPMQAAQLVVLQFGGWCLHQPYVYLIFLSNIPQ